ncbi:MAG: molybdate ABC transporter substrate-binding protein [Mariprofundaceae bacterium]|nr:molybdate ABC transporter substrate-binding protein [Mariprofundaceae bacterium]
MPSLIYAQESITVAVASSYYEKAKVYSATFEKTHDVMVRVLAGSTGRLYNQIKQGAPFDVFIAADQERPALLGKKSQVIGYGYLGLQIGKGLTHDLHVLTHASIRHIVIANPKVAPFGKVAQQALMQAGLWKKIEPKLVYAQNALQASMMVEQGWVDAAFVPVVNKEQAIALLPYVAVLLNTKPQADLFIHMLRQHDK